MASKKKDGTWEIRVFLSIRAALYLSGTASISTAASWASKLRILLFLAVIGPALILAYMP